MHRSILAPVVAVAAVVLMIPAGIGVPSPGSPVTWSASDVPTVEAGAADHPETELSLAIDPLDTEHVIEGSIDFHNIRDLAPGPLAPLDPVFVKGLVDTAHMSTDGGRTWTKVGPMPIVDNDGNIATCDAVSVDPWTTFDANGVGYFSMLAYGSADPTVSDPCNFQTMSVSTTHDGGLTWSTPVVVAHADDALGCAPDRDTLTADPNRPVVYLTMALIGCGPGDIIEDQPMPLVISHTSDGGLHWSTPIPITAPDETTAYPASPRVAPDGSLYVAYLRDTPFNGCLYTVGTTSGKAPVSAEVVVAHSVDQGLTWTRHVLGDTCDNEFQTPEEPMGGTHLFSEALLSIDPVTGRIVAAWSSRDLPNSQVHVATSLDGVTWSAPVTIGDVGRSDYMPTPNDAGGVIRMIYLSMVSPGLFDIRYRESSDGVTWTAPTILNTAASCTCWTQVSGDAPPPDVDVGDYLTLDAHGGKIIAAWPDDRDPAGAQTAFARVGSY